MLRIDRGEQEVQYLDQAHLIALTKHVGPSGSTRRPRLARSPPRTAGAARVGWRAVGRVAEQH